MAHYAFLNEQNIVTEVIVGKNEDDTDTLPESFANWEAYYLSKMPQANDCKRTSYNTRANEHILDGSPFRGNYAGIGYIYDSVNDVFLPPKPSNNHELDNSTWTWLEITE